MDELETTETSHPVGSIILAVIVSLSLGITLGRAWQIGKDKPATTLWDGTMNAYREMQDVSTFPSYKGEEMTQRWEIKNDDAGISYIEIHFLPAKFLPKLHEDVNNPETDGQKPSTKEADDWATKK